MAKSLHSLSDAELIAVAEQTIAAITGTPADYGLVAADVTELTTLTNTFDTDVTAQIAAQAAAKAATQTKEASRTPLENKLRLVRDSAKTKGASDAEIAATAIPIGGEKVPPSATVPAASVDTSERLRHTISWAEAATPDNKRKPRGVMGAEIYVKLDGPPPTDEKQCTFVTVDSATPYTAEYDGADAGKMAHYMIRWRMRDGSVGAWGETVSATITG